MYHCSSACSSPLPHYEPGHPPESLVNLGIPWDASLPQSQDPAPRLTLLTASRHSGWSIWIEGCLYIKGSGSGLHRETAGWHLPDSSPRLAFQQPVPSLYACPCSHLQNVGVSHFNVKASGLWRSRFLFSSSFFTISVSFPSLGDLVLGMMRGGKGIFCPEIWFQAPDFLLISDSHQVNIKEEKFPNLKQLKSPQR